MAHARKTAFWRLFCRKRPMRRAKNHIIGWHWTIQKIWTCSVVFFFLQNIGPGRRNSETAAKYINQVLQPHIVHYIAWHQNMSQHNNARAHTARATKEILEQNNFRVMPWTALNPALKHIERWWDEIQGRSIIFNLDRKLQMNLRRPFSGYRTTSQ